MRSWLATVFILILLTSIVLAFTDHASAQSDEPVRVLELSSSGYEHAHALAFSPDGKHLAVGGTSGIYLFDLQKSSQSAFIRTEVWARSLTFLPRSNSLVVGLFDNTIKFWRIPGLEPSKTLYDPDGWVRSISLSQDGSLLASASDDDTIRIWRTDTDELTLVLNDVSGVRAVALSPDGNLVAGALADNTVRVWSVANGESLYILKGHTDWPRALAFSPDGQLLASGGFDKAILLWNMMDGGLQRRLTGHTSSVLGIAFSPDGQTLASGSVDQTVLLWDIHDSDPRNILQGHADFVYAVAFSPDGKTLASGSGDNTVRLWDLEQLAEISSGEVPPTASDCRQCHHRRGQNEPPRVIDLSCEACHPGGIGLSWCPAFPRSSSIEQTPVQYHATYDVSGVPVNDEDIAVVLASPGNGETFYVMQGFMAPEIISGRVYYEDRATITAVNVRLDMLSNGQIIDSLVTSPTESGDFSFNVAINPDSPPAYSSKPATRQCIICHDDSLTRAGVPTGTVHFRVTATAPDGAHASDERWARIDASENITLPIQVLDEETGEPLPGLLVEASTILYEWRDRYASGYSDSSGNAWLVLETMSQAPTVYEISIPPQILNGSLYASPQAVRVTLDPHSGISPTVTLMARALKGQVNGLFNPPIALKDTNIWALHLPVGPVYRTSLTQDGFDFEDIPVGRYLLAPDYFSLAERNLSTSALSVDLYESTEATVAFEVIEGRLFSGTVRSREDSFLPFAWIRLDHRDDVRVTDPVSGKFLLSGDEADTAFAIVSAPGYYSLSQSIASLDENLDFQLVARPETQFLKWGNGQITLPPETKARATSSDIALEHGWLWGENSAASQAIQIHLSDMDIDLMSGQFALEQPANGTGWLYVYEGKANVVDNSEQAGVQVRGGEMLALLSGASPIPLESAVVMALHPPLDEAPVFEVVEPSLGAKLQKELAKAGIGVMQMITFITYIISLVTLITIIFYPLFLRRKKSRPIQEK